MSIPDDWSRTPGGSGDGSLDPLNPGGPSQPGFGEPVTQGYDEDAYQAMLAVLRDYGLESLAPVLLGFFQQGYSEAEINLRIQETAEYKQRFAANEQRRKKGLAVLSPAEYLAAERSYREVMSSAGMPVGFYDDPSDFTNWLADDVSPVEINQRVQVARQLIDTLDPNVRSAFENWYTTGDMVAYALDRERATTVLERQYRAAQIGGAAQAQGVGSVGRDLAERIAETGATADQAAGGFATVSRIAPATQRLSSLYGGQYTEEDAVDEVFFASADAAERRKGLASQERAQFRGSAGVTNSSLSARTAGQV